MANLAQRQRVWIANGPDEYVPCELINVTDSAVQVKTEDGGSHTFQTKDIRMFTRNPPAMEGIDDLLQSTYLDEPNILYSLEVRFNKNHVYTATGPIMIAVNPWQVFDIYNPQIVQQYAQLQNPEGANPHIFLVASASYRTMCKTRKNQSILISGESGAGKTESTKYVMQFLATVGGRGDAGGGQQSIEQQVLESNPVLEAFGNAKTLRNDNSSRFGKYIDIHFDNQNMVSGCSIQTYLLERSRVTAQSKGERNYHIFYQVCAGAATDGQLAQACCLAPATQFKFCTSGDCITVDSINDTKSFERTKNALNFIGVEPDKSRAMFMMLGAILHLGNMSIESDGDGSRIADSPSVGAVCQLLGINPEDLRKAICTRTIDAAGEKTQVQQTAEKASASLVALTKALYSRLFKYLVMRLNQRLHNDSFRCTIAVLDIFGFEHFQANFFEQFCINYANEKLQQHFNQYNFTLEQKEYDKEGIPWSNSDFVDNALCLELIEKKPGGVLSILDEECIMPQGADETFLEKLTKHAVDQAKNPHFRTTKNRRQQFIIVHYAGEVTYTVQGFLEKNKDELQPQVVDMMRAAGFAFVPELFAEAAGAKVAGGKRASSLMFDSITFQFKTQLAQLMEAINKTDPHFVRCVNPNGQKKPRVFDKLNVLKQLRCGGVIEAVRMARERYPCRYLHDLFLFTYGCLAPQIQQSGGDVKSMTGRLVQELQIPSEQWKMGKTKIFLRREVIDVLDKRRAQLVGKYALKIQKRARQYVAAKKVQRLMRTRKAAQLIQRATKRAVQQNFCFGRVQQIREAKLAREREMMAKAEQKKKQREAEQRAAQERDAAAAGQQQQMQMQEDMRRQQEAAASAADQQQQMQAPDPTMQPQQQPSPMMGAPAATQAHAREMAASPYKPGAAGGEDPSAKPSPLCIRIQVHAVEGGVTSTYVFHVDKLAASLRSSVTVKDRKSFLKFYPQSFLGSDAIEWLRGHALTCLMDMHSNKDEEKTKRLSRSVALLLGQKLLDVGVFRQVTGSPTKPLEDPNALFRFHEDEKEGPLLNCRRIWYQNAREPLIVVSELLRKMLALDLANPRLKDGADMRELTAATAELQLVNINGLSRAELLAFFLNAFNLMVLHGHIVRSTADMCNYNTQRMPFMRVVQYMIAAYNYSLEEIEGRLFCRVMRAKYPRKSDQYKAPEPRVHFALSLGAISSPRIRIYTAQGLERELEEAAVEYCNPIEFNETTREVSLPKVFKWHKEDFGSSKADVLRYYAKYAPEEVRRQIILLATSNVFKIKYRKFDWRISYEKIRRESQMALMTYNAQHPHAARSPAPGGMGGPASAGRASAFPGGAPVPNPGMMGHGEYQNLDQVAELPVMREQRGGGMPAQHVTEALPLYQSNALLSADVADVTPGGNASQQQLVQNRMRALAQVQGEEDPTAMMGAAAAGGAPPEANLYGTLSAPAYGPPSKNTANPEMDAAMAGYGGDDYRHRAQTGMMPPVQEAGESEFRVPNRAPQGEFRRPGGR